MKNAFLSGTIAIVALFVFAGGVAFAQTQPVALPPAGLMPDSPFYFLDRFTEAIRDFFTFDPAAKAHLRMTFAAERVSEIKTMLETKGVEAKGLDVAESRLRTNLADAAKVVAEQKEKGKDMGNLAGELDDESAGLKTVLGQTFAEETRALKAKEKDLKEKVLVADRAGDTAQVEALAKELDDVKAQREALGVQKDDQEKALDEESEPLKEVMGIQKEAEKAIREAEQDKQELVDESAKDNVVIPAGSFDAFDGLLAQAKSALATGNYQDAKNLAKEAKKNLHTVEKAIENLKEAKDNEDEVKATQEEHNREAGQAQDEQARESAKKEAEKQKEDRKKAEEETKKAEEQLREVGKGQEHE